MSQKRKLEEFHDPDYPQSREIHDALTTASAPPSKKACSTGIASVSTPPATNSPEDRLERIKSIITREFDAELRSKEQEIDEIDRRIARGRTLLAKVRYAVVYSYYTKKNLTYPEEEQLVIDDQLQNDSALSVDHLTGEPALKPEESVKPQPAIHPSLKKILGKRPLDYNEILKVRPMRQAAKTATEKFIEMKKPTGSTKLKMQNITIPAEPVDEPPVVETPEPTEVKTPKYVSPQQSNVVVPQVNSARGRNQTKHTLVVGNTSKYIGDEERDSVTNVTHKWLIYLTMKTATPIEQIVAKVRFYLHESYKPNDIVEITSPPFHLSKRGWGEFPVRLILYFHPHIQEKPMQLFHNLLLDKKHTGLQTIGGETVVELWLSQPSPTSIASPVVKNETEEKPSCPSPSFSLSSGFQLDAELPANLLASPGGPKSQKPQAISIKETVIKVEADAGYTEAPKGQNIAGNSIAKPVATALAGITGIKLNTQPVPALKLATAVAGQAGIAAAAAIPPTAGVKRFMKCIDKNGKVSFVQVVVDPNNPKIIRMIAGGAGQIIKTVTTPGAAATTTATPRIITLPKQLVISASAGGQTPITLPRLNVAPPGAVQSVMSKPSLNQLKGIIPMAPQAPTSTTKVAIPSNPLPAAPQQTTPAKRLTKPTQPQQSLLKPQVSLLRSANVDTPKTPLPSAADKRNLTMITVKNIKGLQNKKINVFIKQETPDKTTDSKALQNRSMAEQLEQVFHKNRFTTVRGAASWLLRQLPLVTPLALKPPYQQSFPFAVDNDEKYQNASIAKQRSNEWLRAKYVTRQLQQHPSLRASTKMWTTKQLVQFGRIFGYTPSQTASQATASESKPSADLRQMIQSEINREHLHNETITLNHMVKAWISKTEDAMRTDHDSKIGVRAPVDDELIVVDDDEATAVNVKTEATGTAGNGVTMGNKGYLRLPENRQTECSFVDEICRSAEIKLQPEAVANGIMHNSAQLILATAMRSFVEELMRRSYASGQRLATPKCKSVSNEDIRRAIASTEHFDFLTNKHLGVAGAKTDTS